MSKLGIIAKGGEDMKFTATDAGYQESEDGQYRLLHDDEGWKLLKLDPQYNGYAVVDSADTKKELTDRLSD